MKMMLCILEVVRRRRKQFGNPSPPSRWLKISIHPNLVSTVTVPPHHPLSLHFQSILIKVCEMPKDQSASRCRPDCQLVFALTRTDSSLSISPPPPSILHPSDSVPALTGPVPISTRRPKSLMDLMDAACVCEAVVAECVNSWGL